MAPEPVAPMEAVEPVERPFVWSDPHTWDYEDLPPAVQAIVDSERPPGPSNPSPNPALRRRVPDHPPLHLFFASSSSASAEEEDSEEEEEGEEEEKRSWKGERAPAPPVVSQRFCVASGADYVIDFRPNSRVDVDPKDGGGDPLRAEQAPQPSTI